MDSLDRVDEFLNSPRVADLLEDVRKMSDTVAEGAGAESLQAFLVSNPDVRDAIERGEMMIESSIPGNQSGLDTKRTFSTGATRDLADHKPDYEGYLSPLVVRAYGRYMMRHSVMADGSRRDSDNWQQGIPLDVYMKSLMRHIMDVWELHRGGSPEDYDGTPLTMEESLCAVLFNAMGYLHELSK